MTRNKIIEELNILEKKYNVNKWTHNEIDLWPLIKIEIFFYLIKAYEKKSILSTKKQKRKSIITLSIISSFKILLLFFKRKKRIKILFSENESYRVNFNGEKINKYFEPLIKNEKLDDNYLIINDTTNYEPEKYYKNILFLDDYITIIKVINSIKKINLSFQCELDSLLKELESKHQNIIYQFKFQKNIISKVNSLISMKFIQKLILKKYTPELIFELCYYSTSRFALNQIAFEKNIPSIDIQHGGIGMEHIAYANWSSPKIGGYSILPKYFWTWDKGSFNTINHWIKKQSFHQIYNGGNPWIIHSILNQKETFNFPIDKKIILYTLQYSSIDKYILETIKITPIEYEWWIRLHPRRLHEKNIIDSQLQINDLTHRVNIDQATSYPLPILLSNTSIHLSGFSGSIIESIQTKTKTLIIDKLGVEYFNYYINSGEAIKVTDKSSSTLLNAIIANQENNIRTEIKDESQKGKLDYFV